MPDSASCLASRAGFNLPCNCDLTLPTLLLSHTSSCHCVNAVLHKYKSWNQLQADMQSAIINCVASRQQISQQILILSDSNQVSKMKTLSRSWFLLFMVLVMVFNGGSSLTPQRYPSNGRIPRYM